MLTTTQFEASARALNDESDVATIDAVRRGQVEQFEKLMRRYNQRLYRVARSLLRDDFEAEEIVQQAWVSAWENLSEFRGAARFSTWMIRIVINACLMRARKTGRTIALDAPDFQEPTMPALNPQDALELKQVTKLMERAIDSLNDGHRAVFVMREVEGLSTAETADALAVTEEVVKTRLHRAKHQLRDELMRCVGQTATEVFSFGNSHCDRIVADVMNVIRKAG